MGVRPGCSWCRGRTHSEAIDDVEGLALWIADAVAVRRIGTPFDVQEAVSNVKSYGEGPVMIWFLEDYRDDTVLVVRVQHFGMSDPADLHPPRSHVKTPLPKPATQKWSHRAQHCPALAPSRRFPFAILVSCPVPD